MSSDQHPTRNTSGSSTNGIGINGCVVAVCACLLLALTGASQTPPANDNYSNRLALTGTNIMFSGTLAGATIEDSQETATFSNLYSGFFTATQSVWWTWTAPTDTVLTLQILDTVYGTPAHPGDPPIADSIVIYSATNGSLTPDGLSLPALAYVQNIPLRAPPAVSLPVATGSNYLIQFVGNSSATHHFRLVAANTPVILTQPRSQAVYSNASALFYVFYAGVAQSNFTFQWYLNGTNLPGETAPMLALTNIYSSMAGAYTVAVSNSAGATLSAPATLTVSQSNFPVYLAAVGVVSNSFRFSVAGEPGRSYRLQSSAHLSNWTPEAAFQLGPTFPYETCSIFFQTNSSQVVTIPNLTFSNLTDSKFFRTIPYVIGEHDTEVCINNLRQIRIAKLLWQRDHNMSAIANPTHNDLLPYFPDHSLPACPDDASQTFDSSYNIGNLQTLPTCKIRSAFHILEDPQ